MGCGLSLLGLAGKASDRVVLAPYMGPARTSEISRACPNGQDRPDSHRLTNVYCEAVTCALVDASTHFLGLPARSRDHVSVGFRMGTLSFGSNRSDDVCSVRVWIPCRFVPDPDGLLVAHLSWTRYCSDHGVERC